MQMQELMRKESVPMNGNGFSTCLEVIQLEEQFLIVMDLYRGSISDAGKSGI